MRVHEIDCCPMRPIGARGLVPGRCLLLEFEGRVVVVDTGIGTADIADPIGRLGRPWVAGCRPLLVESSAAVRQVEALGYGADDVSDVVLTHLDIDHAGGVGDFPDARVHVHAAEARIARAGARRLGAQGARYRSAQWRDADLHLHEPGPVSWKGIDGCIEVPDLDECVLLVPLFGHSAGHCGVAVRQDAEGWLLHVGDALFRPIGGTAPLTMELFDRFIEHDRRAGARSRDVLHGIATEPDLTIVTSHGVVGAGRGRTAGRPTR